MKNKNLTLILALIIIIGAFLRFYKLDWGQGLFTHPDEYHLVISASQLSFPNQMNPHFFSYGTVSIYLMYFTHQLLPNLNLFLIGRFYSALFATLTIFIVYKITKLILSSQYALVAAILVALTPGLIQQAHFATPESNLTFFLLTSLFFCLNYLKHKKIKDLGLGALFFGLALGTKVSSVIFAPVLFLTVITAHRTSLPKITQRLTLTSLITLTTLLVTSPFIFLDWPDFFNNIKYEGGLAAGNFIVFYTRQFINTVPLLFQIEKILPYALGPALLIFGLLGFFILLFDSLKKKNALLFITAAGFLLIFLYNSFLFAKWTRFLAPTFPFFSIFAVYLISKLHQAKMPRLLFITLQSTFFILTILWSLSFFSIYQRDDVRSTAAKWIAQNTQPGNTFLVEDGNMIDVPLPPSNTKISLNFYNLEENPLGREKILLALDQSDYFIIESRRVFFNHQRLPKNFPVTTKFYNALFKGDLGFTQVQEVTSYPQVWIADFGLEISDEKAEETWSVFDHPVIRIFKKSATLTRQDYAKALAN